MGHKRAIWKKYEGEVPRKTTRCGATNKIRFTSEEAALDRGAFIAQQAGANRQLGRHRAYQCEYCGGWHLTTKLPRQNQK